MSKSNEQALIWCKTEILSARENPSYTKETLISNLLDRIYAALGEGPYHRANLASHLIVEAGVRYWEDASINEQKDTLGTLIPFRRGDLWCPIIELATGKIVGWPQGVTARIHYKVCDDGEYWLGNAEGKKFFKCKGHYVPDDLLAIDGCGYGDYIIMTVTADGLIDGWPSVPSLDADDWKPVDGHIAEHEFGLRPRPCRHEGDDGEE